MKSQLAILGFGITLFAITSCKKKFLDVPAKNVVVRQEYVTDVKTTGEFLNGIYIEMSMSVSAGLSYPEVIADNIKPVIGYSAYTACYSWNQQADNSGPSVFIDLFGQNANGFWKNGIRIARQCSFVIETIDQYHNQNPQLADNYKGQALVLRAWVHWLMVNIYAQSYSFTADASHPGIPYISTSDWRQPASRLSVNKVYEEIVNDLSTAIPLIPQRQISPVSFTYSLVNKLAAKAILARVSLFKEDWTMAKNLAREVLMAVPLMTVSDGYPGKLFTNEEKEAIFQQPPAQPGVPRSAGSFYTSYSGELYGEPALCIPTLDIVEILRENPADVRSVWAQQIASEWKIRKFPSGIIPGFSTPQGSYYQTLIRSSEMCLTVAESYAHLSQLDSAIFFLDAIRKRAWPAAPNTVATGMALMDSIYKERRKELCFEGFRMFDIQRWKQSVVRLDAPILTATTLPYGSNKAIAPIPTSDVNIIGMAQNPDY